MNAYDLDETTEESFEFILEGHTYKMKYPTTEEVLAAAKITDETKQLEWIYRYITSEDPAAPPIDKAIGKVNVKKLQRFNKMVKTEFGVED